VWALLGLYLIVPSFSIDLLPNHRAISAGFVFPPCEVSKSKTINVHHERVVGLRLSVSSAQKTERERDNTTCEENDDRRVDTVCDIVMPVGLYAVPVYTVYAACRSRSVRPRCLPLCGTDTGRLSTVPDRILLPSTAVLRPYNTDVAVVCSIQSQHPIYKRI
jgi:hypothetical protein